mmetsp:Transcript_12842/g.26581  ORF Transcript_12842/g.26581 Transcript_12842/m.26581 type:complete len:376 (-) Transcript_12842:464-1591(-)
MSDQKENPPKDEPLEPRTLAFGDAATDANNRFFTDDEKKMDELDDNDDIQSSTAHSLDINPEEEDPESTHDPSFESSDKNENPKVDRYTAQKNIACELSPIVISEIDKLPPLPEPRNDILRHENPRGFWTVTTGVIVCVFLTHYIALTLVLPSESFYDENDGEDYEKNPTAKIVFWALIYAESLAALLCTTGILYADPCVAQRSEETCNPIPKAVESWVLSGDQPRPLGLDHYLRGADQRIYCTKCLLWRKPGVTHFHCAICQRCCAYHDHHCNVFGKCIAGNMKFWEGSAGNRTYFYGLLVSGAFGFFTVFASFLYAACIRYRPAYALPIGVAVMLTISCCCLGNGPFNIVLWPLFRLLRTCKRTSKRCCRNKK